jgi:hypothetical protein
MTNQIQRRILVAAVPVLYVVLMALVASCDSSVNDDSIEDKALTPQSKVLLDNGTISLWLDERALLKTYRWFFDSTDTGWTTSPFSSSGLWLAAEQGNARSNVTLSAPTPNGFEPDTSTTHDPGIFLVTRDSLENPISNWPIALGAPIDTDGRPLLYGDQMAWGAYQPHPGYDSARSLQGLRIGTSAYLHDRADLASTLFIRYDISNVGEEAVNDLYIGYGADTDISLSYKGDHPCRPLYWWHNQTGYDPDRHLTYTYVSHFPDDGDLPTQCYSVVEGYSILDMSSPRGLGDDILAHRIRTRDTYGIYPEFSDLDLFEPGQPVLSALRGLTATGAPMIDPTTGQPTRFAYSGDPIAGTGWIGERIDVRSLLSLQPIYLAPGETRSVTVAWFFVHGSDLEDALGLLRMRFDAIMAERDLWDF